jgi:hypothetical protein
MTDKLSGVDGIDFDTDDGIEQVEQSPYALKTDAWGIHYAKEVLQTWEHDGLLKDADGKPIEIDEFTATDCFTACFDVEPQFEKSCVDPVRTEFMQALLNTPEYQALHQHTALNDCAAEIAALGYSREVVALRGEKAAPPGSIQRDIQVLRHANSATSTAKKEVDSLRDAQAACGMGDGMPGNRMDAKRVAALYKALRESPDLRKIFELAGRFRRFAQGRQRMKSMHGYDDMVGTTQDADIGRLLPSELAAMDDPDLEIDFLRRFSERQTFCREYRGLEPAARGPIIVIVDESGSMSGEKAQTAKGIALAMAWIARQQKRSCALVAFSGGTEGRRLDLEPGKENDEQLCEWLEAFIGGGTDLDVPLVQVPHWYPNTDGKTDLLCITDAIVHAPPNIVKSFNAWKAKTKCRMISIIVDSPDPGDLAKVSDECHLTRKLGLDCEGVQEALSI